MGRCLTKIILCAFAVCLSTTIFAGKHDNKKPMHKWTCTTNASSAATDSDKKADDMMTKKALSGSQAFGYALSHCRDCSKITCEITDTATQTSSNNNSNSNMNSNSPSSSY